MLKSVAILVVITIMAGWRHRYSVVIPDDAVILFRRNVHLSITHWSTGFRKQEFVFAAIMSIGDPTFKEAVGYGCNVDFLPCLGDPCAE